MLQKINYPTARSINLSTPDFLHSIGTEEGGRSILAGGSHSVAFANQDLAQKNGCLACHAVENKVVGPAYQDVAKKYKGQKDAEATIVGNIKKGGSGKWGPIPMPTQAALSDADAKTLAKWILGMAK